MNGVGIGAGVGVAKVPLVILQGLVGIRVKGDGIAWTKTKELPMHLTLA